MNRIYTLLIGLLGLTSLQAATYYCSPNGSGTGNAYNSPCSLSQGLNRLSQPGDTLYLLGGQYNIGKTTVSLNGSASANIVISGYPGETAILDFRTVSYGTRGLCISNSSTYVHVKNLTLRYSGKNNLYNEGSYCTFERLDIYGSADTGCQMKNGGHNLIKNCDSHDNFDYKLDKSGNFTQVDFGGNADGFADKQFTGPGNHYIGCRAWNNSDDGWDFYQRVSDGNATIIEDCICYRNGPAEYDMRNHPRYQTDQAWFDQFLTPVTVSTRQGNTVSVSVEHYTNCGNANGFKLGGGYTVHNVVVHHCLAVGNNAKGFDQNNDCGTMQLYNNTAYANYQNFGFWDCVSSDNSHASVLDLRNCVSLNSLNANGFSTSNTTNNHNSWNTQGVSCTAADFLSLDTTQILHARQADGSLPIMTLMHLVEGSDLIDAGAVLTYAYYGAAPDLGCYERTDGDPVIPDDTIITPDPGTEPELPYECREGAYRIAFVTIPDSPEDYPLIPSLRSDSALCIDILSANEANADYSPYDVIILGPKPSSGCTAYNTLKGLAKPMLVLKPWIFKPSVWNWGTAVNTSNLSIKLLPALSDSAFLPLLTAIPRQTEDRIPLFTNCNTNAVTAISDWTNATGMIPLAAPVSHDNQTAMAYFPAGSGVGTTTFLEPMLMLGISEYSTASLTSEALILLRNAVYFLLGEDPTLPEEPDTALENTPVPAVRKLMIDGRITLITPDGRRYNILGQPLD